MKIRIGTRGSPLAKWQAEWIHGRLSEAGADCEMVVVSTRGDRDRIAPVSNLGGIGVFTKELQRALLANEIDIAVHSLKDLPTDEVPGLVLAAVPLRAPAGDVLVSRHDVPLEELPHAATIGTGSLRRRAQLLFRRPDLQVHEIRGNVETRLQKLDQGDFDALVLAEAGLSRLGLAERITQRLPSSVMMSAVGQGALGVETREGDTASRDALKAVDDAATHRTVSAERSLLATLRGGCLAPVGAFCHSRANGSLRLEAVVLDSDGTRRLEASDSDQPDHAIELGRRVARDLIQQGAADLIRASRSPQ